MEKMIEIELIFPHELKIPVPEQLLEELAQVVNEEKLSEVITEALTGELKKIRFRTDLAKARSKVV